MNKICTSIEQSKKLVELGIDVNTADLIYQPIMDIDSMSNVGFAKIPLCFSFNETKECNIQYLPAWSLSALLELMPKLYEFEDDPDDGGCQPNLCKDGITIYGMLFTVFQFMIQNGMMTRLMLLLK